MINLTDYLSDSINKIFRNALAAAMKNTKESAFLLRAAAAQKTAAQKRRRAQQTGEPVPPFLIASIATGCNLHCAGCYARFNHACGDREAAGELSAARWGEIFEEAEELGVSFILLAGGEPFERPDVLEKAAECRRLIFPVFTNGTLFSERLLEKFDRCRNLIPVVSIEGGREQTDARRGAGTYDLVSCAMQKMNSRGIFYGASVTVTKSNLCAVSDENFAAKLREQGCRLLFLVEYVPVDGNLEAAPGDCERRMLDERLDVLRRKFPDMIFLSFPGDEKSLGGCLAAGRGFFHINAFGGAEPCPFSPYSDVSIKTGSLRQALESVLFRRIRESALNAESHAGGCALFEVRETVAAMLGGKAAEADARY